MFCRYHHTGAVSNYYGLREALAIIAEEVNRKYFYYSGTSYELSNELSLALTIYFILSKVLNHNCVLMYVCCMYFPLCLLCIGFECLLGKA